jgi:hypothetical protein
MHRCAYVVEHPALVLIIPQGVMLSAETICRKLALKHALGNLRRYLAKL